MDGKTESEEVRYPIHISRLPNVNGPIDMPCSEAELLKQMQGVLRDPSFLVLQNFVKPVNNEEQSGFQYDLLPSPLFTLLNTSGDALDMILKKPNIPPHVSEILSKQRLALRFINSKITLPDGAMLQEQSPIPLNVFAEPLHAARILLETCQTSFCCAFLTFYNQCLYAFPGRVVRLPLSTIRVRDIVIYRFFKTQLAKAGLSDIKVRTDNLQRPNSKEYTTDPFNTFCAHCMKVELTHQRCSGCAVAYYCSAECQKKGWIKHKSECKERQKEQKEWDAMVAKLA